MHDNLNDEWWWFLAMKVKFKKMWLAFTCELQFTFQLTVVITTQLWATLTERILTIHPPIVKVCVTARYLRDGIVLREMQGKKYQQRQWMVITVIQPTQAGWEVMNLQWEMVKYLGRSVSPEVVTLARIQLQSQWKTVDPTLSTNWFHLRLVVIATVAQTKHEADEWEKSWKWKTQWAWLVVFNSSKI